MSFNYMILKILFIAVYYVVCNCTCMSVVEDHDENTLVMRSSKQILLDKCIYTSLFYEKNIFDVHFLDSKDL